MTLHFLVTSNYSRGSTEIVPTHAKLELPLCISGNLGHQFNREENLQVHTNDDAILYDFKSLSEALMTLICSQINQLYAISRNLINFNRREGNIGSVLNKVLSIRRLWSQVEAAWNP